MAADLCLHDTAVEHSQLSARIHLTPCTSTSLWANIHANAPPHAATASWPRAVVGGGSHRRSSRIFRCDDVETRPLATRVVAARMWGSIATTGIVRQPLLGRGVREANIETRHPQAATASQPRAMVGRVTRARGLTHRPGVQVHRRSTPGGHGTASLAQSKLINGCSLVCSLAGHRGPHLARRRTRGLSAGELSWSAPPRKVAPSHATTTSPRSAGVAGYPAPTES